MRLFLAVNLDGAVRRAIYRDAEALRRAANGVVWVRVELLHLTLKFLGERQESEVAGFAGLAEENASRHRRVRLTIGGHRRLSESRPTTRRMDGSAREGERKALATAVPVARGHHHVEVSSVDLMQSELSVRGPTYTLPTRAALVGS